MESIQNQIKIVHQQGIKTDSLSQNTVDQRVKNDQNVVFTSSTGFDFPDSVCLREKND